MKKQTLLISLLAGSLVFSGCSAKMDKYATTKAGDITAKEIVETIPGNELNSAVATATIQKILLDKFGDSFSDLNIEKEYERLAEKQGGKEKFEEALKTQGLTPEQMKKSIKIKAAQIQLVLSEKGITESKLKEEYKKDPKQSNISHILIATKTEKNPQGLSDEEAKKQAEDLLKKAKSGEDFGELAKYHSNDTTTVSKQGSLGWNSETNNNFVPEFKKAVSELKKGEISPLVKTEYGYHIIKKNDEKEYTFDEVKIAIAEKLALAEIEKDRDVLQKAFKKLFEEYNVKSDNAAIQEYLNKIFKK